MSLIERWVHYMEEHGIVLKAYPLLGVAETLLAEEATQLRCGAGWAQFNIQTDGTIIPCPAMSGMKEYYLGSIKDANSQDFKKITVGAPCTNCELLWICGGRCLYANITKLWGDEGFRLVCSTVGFLVGGVRSVMPRIHRLIDNGRISISDFQYVRFNSCEITP